MITRPLARALCAALTVACASSSPARDPVASSASSQRNAPTLSGADQARELSATRQHVTAMRWEVHRRMERARDRGDRAETRCLDARLSELDAAGRMLTEQNERFCTADEARDEHTRALSFRRAMALRGRANDVSAEARRCWMGEVTDGLVTTMVVEDTR